MSSYLRPALRKQRWSASACDFSLTRRHVLAPPSSDPAHADAVVVLAGGTGERLEVALHLMRAGRSDVLVLNRGVDWYLPEALPIQKLCREGSPDFEVVCVTALPDSTKGEARVISDLAEQRGWTSLAVVTTDHHISRAARWFERCFDGTVYPVAAPFVTKWPDLRHELLGVAAQLTIDRSCDS